MKEDILKNLWKQSIKNVEISIQPDQLFVSLTKAKNLEQLRRAYEFSDLFGGIILLFISVLMIFIKPDILDGISLQGKVGAVIIFGVFSFYHFNAFRIKRIPLPNSPALMQILFFEKEKIERRISLLSNFIWYVAIGLAGGFLLFNSFLNTVGFNILIISFLSIFGAIIFYLNKKSLQEEFMPLKSEIDERIKIIKEGI